jgi:hypothetical protein
MPRRSIFIRILEILGTLFKSDGLPNGAEEPTDRKTVALKNLKDAPVVAGLSVQAHASVLSRYLSLSRTSVDWIGRRAGAPPRRTSYAL